MGLNEFKDRLFDIINDSDGLPIMDIITDDEQDAFRILLDDLYLHIQLRAGVPARGF